MYRFYVSSYAKGKEKGLYVCTLDETKNELHLNKHIPTEDFPSYVIKKDDYLYVSLKDARVGEGGGIASYHIEEDDLSELIFKIECLVLILDVFKYTRLCDSFKIIKKY